MSSTREPVPVVFLPGILMPVALRYRALLDALGGDVRPRLKELEVYGGASVPPPGYSLHAELDGIAHAADAAGLEAFHLYGHSGGGSCALAFAARTQSACSRSRWTSRRPTSTPRTFDACAR